MENVKLPLGGNFAVGSIGQIAVNVKELGRAVGFYRDILRLPFLFATGTLAFFDAGGVRLMLDKTDRPEFDHPSSILYFTVPDIRTGYQALVERGVRFVAAPSMIAKLDQRQVWMAFFRDSEENIMALMAEVTTDSY
ncbi:MAG: VOC family protein [Terriglobales bacterium]